MRQEIKHIIFDLGGVVLNLDYQLTAQAFKTLGVQDFDQQFSQLQQNNFFNLWETGNIAEEDFVREMKAHCRAHTTDAQILNAWNAMLLDFPLRRLQLLERLRNQYDTYLLSNTNIIHEKAFNKKLKDDHGLSHVGLLFDRFYFSHRVGMRKPNAEVFHLVLNENNLKPKHTLFIDDSEQHIATAKNLGMHTKHLVHGMTLEDDVFLPKNKQ